AKHGYWHYSRQDRYKGVTVSKIFYALTIVREERLKSLPPVDREPGRGSSDVLQRSVVPTDVDLFGGLEPTTRLPGKVALSHKKRSEERRVGKECSYVWFME